MFVYECLLCYVPCSTWSYDELKNGTTISESSLIVTHSRYIDARCALITGAASGWTLGWDDPLKNWTLTVPTP